jgi:hypothetical protein
VIPVDATGVELERYALAWSAVGSDAREAFFGTDGLERRDFSDFELRGLFTRVRALWRDGRFQHGYEIRGTRLAHTWGADLAESDRVALERLAESRDVPIFLPPMAETVIEQLRRLTKERAVLAAAEQILAGAGGDLSDDLLEWLLRQDA